MHDWGDDERHSAWGLIGASRVQSSAPGATLFDSDIQHQHYVVVRLRRAIRRRSLNRDWIGADGRTPIIEVAMSEAQWASFVSSMNTGDGVPCSIDSIEGERMDALAYEPRMGESIAEVRAAATKYTAEIQRAFDAFEEKRSAANLRTLKFAIENAPGNMAFAAKSLSEHAENVVQRARADIEAMVLAKAEQVGLDPGEVRPVLGEGADDGS